MTIFSSDLKQRVKTDFWNFESFYSAFFAKSLHNSDSRLTFSLFRSLFWDNRVYFRSCTLNANSGIAFCLYLIILLHFKRKCFQIFLFIYVPYITNFHENTQINVSNKNSKSNNYRKFVVYFYFSNLQRYIFQFKFSEIFWIM